MDNEQKEDVILGKNLSNKQRIVAFLSILLVYFFYCYNWMVEIFVRPTFLNDIGFTLEQASKIYSMLPYGTVPGTLIFGTMSTKVGKKRTLMFIGMMFSIMTFIPLLNPYSYNLWRIGRFITGFALGGVFGTAIPLVADLFPQRYRGKLAAICTSTFSLAMIFAGQLYALLGDSNWKILMLTAVIPPIIGVIMIFFFVPDDSKYMREIRNKAKKENIKINYLEMYKGKYKFIGLGVIFLSGTNFISYALFTNNATTYLTTSLGLSAAIAGSIYSVQGIGQLIGYNFWGYISDKFGRKVPLIGMFLTSIMIFFFIQNSPTNILTFYIISFFIGFSFGFSGPWGAYYTELFPEKFRALSPGISFNGGKIIMATLLPMVTVLAASINGPKGIFLTSMGVVFLGAIVWFFLPETLIKKRNTEKTNININEV